MVQKKAYALFDFDGTLSRGDSIIPFLWFCVHKKAAPTRALFTALGAILNYQLKLIDDTQAKEAALAFLKGWPLQRAEALAAEFYQAKLSKRLFPQGVWEIQKCREEGMEVLIVTASPDVYLHLLPQRLGVQGVLATRCGLDEGNVYTGSFASKNCRGFEKTLRIAEYLAARGHELDTERSRSYGDSYGDLPMLQLTHHPVVVNGKRRLLKALPQARREIWK